ncbi:hypothetical protein VTK73DRAFT_3473 [Phialemonium thermophilum]|uniref:Putative gamma-glutamylcyclotransferase n=1 Tax=Phialemonium thermophilum TaxID=223376 RepID=A0ABR3WZG4_9PEZI
MADTARIGVITAPRESNGGTHCAFFYGTLMAPEVFFTVCYRTARVPEAIARLHDFRPALLKGYCRRRVRSADYPGIVEDAGHEVRGTYVTGLTDANMAHLDRFEGSEYERRTVRVRVLVPRIGEAEGSAGVDYVEGEEQEAEVYVYLYRDQLEEKEWDFEHFRQEKLRAWTRDGLEFDPFEVL